MSKPAIVYTIKEVAEITKLTTQTIWNYVKAGKLPADKVGGQWRITEQALNDLLAGK